MDVHPSFPQRLYLTYAFQLIIAFLQVLTLSNDTRSQMVPQESDYFIDEEIIDKMQQIQPHDTELQQQGFSGQHYPQCENKQWFSDIIAGQGPETINCYLHDMDQKYNDEELFQGNFQEHSQTDSIYFEPTEITSQRHSQIDYPCFASTEIISKEHSRTLHSQFRHTEIISLPDSQTQKVEVKGKEKNKKRQQNNSNKPTPKLKNSPLQLFRALILLIIQILCQNKKHLKKHCHCLQNIDDEGGIYLRSIVSWLKTEQMVSDSSILHKWKKQKVFNYFHFNTLLEIPQFRLQLEELLRDRNKLQTFLKQKFKQTNQEAKNTMINAYINCYTDFYGWKQIFGFFTGYTDQRSVSAMIIIIELAQEGYKVRINNIQNHQYPNKQSFEIPDEYLTCQDQRATLSNNKQKLKYWLQKFKTICQDDIAQTKGKNKMTVKNYIDKLKREQKALEQIKIELAKIKTSQFFKEKNYLEKGKDEQIKGKQQFLFHTIETTWKVANSKLVAKTPSQSGTSPESQTIKEFFETINPMIMIFGQVYNVRGLWNKGRVTRNLTQKELDSYGRKEYLIAPPKTKRSQSEQEKKQKKMQKERNAQETQEKAELKDEPFEESFIDGSEKAQKRKKIRKAKKEKKPHRQSSISKDSQLQSLRSIVEENLSGYLDTNHAGKTLSVVVCEMND